MIVSKSGMAWIGKAINIQPIEGADRIVRADMVCGAGGKWGAVIRKSDLEDYGEFGWVVFIPDAVVPEIPQFDFMMDQHYTVKPRRFKGCPSEVLAVPRVQLVPTYPALELRVVGDDVTDDVGVKKFEKEDGVGAGQMAGGFPAFIPKTDEINFQAVPHLRDFVVNKLCYIATKYDGSSNTVFVKDGEIRACTRNRELKDPRKIAETREIRPEDVPPVWRLVDKYGLREKMIALEGKFGPFALQWECVGPGIQKNRLNLVEHDLRLFDVWYIDDSRYGSLNEILHMSVTLGIPMVEYKVEPGREWSDDELRKMAEGVYQSSGHAREGIVIRTFDYYDTWYKNHVSRVSFKVINLEY